MRLLIELIKNYVLKKQFSQQNEKLMLFFKKYCLFNFCSIGFKNNRIINISCVT